MPARSPVKFRIKGTGVYLQPMASAAYETVGSGRRSLSMRAPNYGPNAALAYAGPQLRSQAREADRKNGIAHTMADRLVANMIGTGIVPQPPSPKARKLWKEWTDQSSPDGTLDFYGQQAQIARAMVVSGEVFGRLRLRRPEDGLVVPLQVQLLESDFVPFDKNEIVGNTGRYIRQGVELDAIGRRAAYWMYRNHPGDRLVIPNFDPMPQRVRASEVLHVYDAFSARPGQVRGEPWITQALAKLKDLDAYDDAELVRKKTAALLVAFIRRNVPEGMSAEELAEAWGDSAEVEDGVGGITLEAGTGQYLEPGESVEWSNPQDVGGQYEIFMRQQFRLLAASAGLLYEQLSGDFSDLNDRTWRAAFNEFKRRCEMWQHHLIVFQFCRPVWARWAALARMMGLLTEEEAPDTVPWIPEAWPYINPVQDIEAITAEIRAGLSSRSKKASERGEDAAEIDREQAADNRRADRHKVKYDSDGRNKKSGGSATARAGRNGSAPVDGEEAETSDNEQPENGDAR